MDAFEDLKYSADEGFGIQVLIGLHRAQLLASIGSRAEALQLLDSCAGQLAGSQEATPQVAHLRLHFALLRTLCQLASGETGSLQQADGVLYCSPLVTCCSYWGLSVGFNLAIYIVCCPILQVASVPAVMSCDIFIDIWDLEFNEHAAD